MCTVVAIVSPVSGNFLTSESSNTQAPITSEIVQTQSLVLDALPITEAPLTGVKQPKNDWLQLPKIPSFIQEEASEPYALEVEEDENKLDLSILTAILGIVLSLYQ